MNFFLSSSRNSRTLFSPILLWINAFRKVLPMSPCDSVHNGTTAKFVLEGFFQDYIDHLCCPGLGYLSLDQAAQRLIPYAFESSTEGINNFSWQPVPVCPTTFIMKNFFLGTYLNLTSFTSKTLPLALSLQALVKSLSVSF